MHIAQLPLVFCLITLPGHESVINTPYAVSKFFDTIEKIRPIFELFSHPFQGGVRGGFESHESNPGLKTSPWPLLGKEGKYNLVFLLAVLHHIPTRSLRLKILKDIHSVLAPGGRLVLSTWNLWQIYFPLLTKGRLGGVAEDFIKQRQTPSHSPLERGRKKFKYWPYLFSCVEKFRHGVWSINDAFVPWKGNRQEDKWQLRYVHSFHKGEMKRLLSQAGFEIEWIKYKDKSGQPASIFTAGNLLAVAIKKNN